MFDRLWPEARTVSDEALNLYRAFGLERGGVSQMFRPAAFAAGVRATLKGHTIGVPVGDVWIMPGLFLVRGDGSIDWHHEFAHAGDHPDFSAIPSP